MLCELPCPYLGMHQTLEAFACWQRDDPCSLSPAPELQQDTAFGASRPDLAKLQQLPRTTSPAMHPGVTHPLTATALSGTGNRGGHWGRASVPSHSCKFTQNVGLYSLKSNTPSQRGKLAGMSVTTNADQETEPVSSTHILKALTPVFWHILLTWDIKSSTSSSFFFHVARGFISTLLVNINSSVLLGRGWV